MDEQSTSPARWLPDEDLPPELLDLAQRVAAQPVPLPTTQDTAHLIERLLAAPMPPQTGRTAHAPAMHPAAAWRVARWRVRLLGPTFWCAGVLLIGLAAIATPEALLHHDAVIPLVLAGPLTAVLGLAHALRTTSRGLREVEASAPLSFATASAGLALALVAFDGLLCAMASAALALLQLAPFAGLVAAWLGPLLLVTGISLPVALRYGVRAAALIGAGPWLLLALWSVIAPATNDLTLFAVPTSGSATAVRLLAGIVGGVLLAWPLARGALGRERGLGVWA